MYFYNIYITIKAYVILYNIYSFTAYNIITAYVLTTIHIQFNNIQYYCSIYYIKQYSLKLTI